MELTEGSETSANHNLTPGNTQKKTYKTEEQYRQMPFADWKEAAPFKELATSALTCLITPVNSALVERIFSLLSSIKTKTRNRMQLNLLDAVVRVRAELLLSSKCCKDFTACPEMLTNFISDKVYVVCSTHSSGEDLELFV
jgi:hypothetical protein